MFTYMLSCVILGTMPYPVYGILYGIMPAAMVIAFAGVTLYLLGDEQRAGLRNSRLGIADDPRDVMMLRWVQGDHS